MQLTLRDNLPFVTVTLAYEGHFESGRNHVGLQTHEPVIFYGFS